MLKYLYCKEVFEEVPNETTLGISLTGCKIKCDGCHSPELWKDTGKILTIDNFERILDYHDGITCVLLMGGEHDINTLKNLFYVATLRTLKTAWYCGLDSIPNNSKDILNYLDYIKLGHFDKELGGLNSPTTNQRFYKVIHGGENPALEDMTFMFKGDKV